MEANYNYYAIDLADIWSFERSLFLNSESSEKFAKRIIDNIQTKIIANDKPSFRLIDSHKENKDFKKYYDRNLNSYINACRDICELYILDYFFSNKSCFQYDQSIILDKDESDFDFWFALKLRQYENKIIIIDTFLIYQLEQSFNSDIKAFLKFLKLNIRQYQDTLFTNRIVKTVNEYMNNYGNEGVKGEDSNNTKGINRLSNKKERKIEGKLHSLLLRKVYENPQYLNKDKNRKGLKNIFVKLKEEKFIDKKTNLENFRSIFQNKEITNKKRIIWTGSIIELNWLVKYLVYKSKKVCDIKNDIWLITAKCFISKSLIEFTVSQLKNASGNKLERKELLESILTEL